MMTPTKQKAFRASVNKAVRVLIRSSFKHEITIHSFHDKRSDHIRSKFYTHYTNDKNGSIICKKIRQWIRDMGYGEWVSCEWWGTDKNYMYPGIIIKHFEV